MPAECVDRTRDAGRATAGMRSLLRNEGLVARFEQDSRLVHLEFVLPLNNEKPLIEHVRVEAGFLRRGTVMCPYGDLAADVSAVEAIELGFFLETFDPKS